jgi:hypothetical protein
MPTGGTNATNNHSNSVFHLGFVGAGVLSSLSAIVLFAFRNQIKNGLFRLLSFLVSKRCWAECCSRIRFYLVCCCVGYVMCCMCCVCDVLSVLCGLCASCVVCRVLSANRLVEKEMNACPYNRSRST